MTQVGLQKQQEGVLFPWEQPPHCLPNTTQPFISLLTGRQSSTNDQGEHIGSSGATRYSCDAWMGTPRLWCRSSATMGTEAQLQSSRPPCSGATPRTTEQNNMLLTMCGLQHMTILQFTLCVCVWSHLCVYSSPHVLTFMSQAAWHLSCETVLTEWI